MVALAVGGIVLVAVLINLALTFNFTRYLGKVQEEQNRLILDTLAELYSRSTSWQAIRLSTMYVGSTTGTQIKVYDLKGRLIVDSLTGMMRGMHSDYWRRRQELRGNAAAYPLYVQGEQVGVVEIVYLGQQGLWSAEALLFRRMVLISAVITGLLAILAAAYFGSKMARRLMGRLTVLAAAAEKWGRGQFTSRVRVSGDDELAVLGETMNRMASRLEAQSDLRKKLTSDISHELRTPLSTIQSYLEAFRDGVLPPDEKHLTAILEESIRLGGLITDLQRLAEAEYSRRAAQFELLPLNAFLAAETERYRPLMKRKDISLVLELPDEEVAVQADKGLLGQVLANLLINAAKYTPAGGQVTISLTAADGEAVIAVADTGSGIAAEHLPHIFERFYRVDPSRTRATGGSGIGLAIVRELTEAMHGRVTVESTPGKGSCFRLYLPL
jgi:signal transduction histidine kinase